MKYEIEGEPGKLFEVRARNDLENCPVLEASLINEGFDGCCYALVNCEDGKDYEVYNCYKLVDGPFIKMPQGLK